MVGNQLVVKSGDAGASLGESPFQVGLVGVQSGWSGLVRTEGVLPAGGVRVPEHGVEAPAQVPGDRPA
jgi:hypothetical protein